MAEAPRYTPKGVQVGSMPAPQVRPDTATAETLQTIGNTIGSLGKSYQYAQDVQERRADEELSARKVKVHGLYQDWDAEAERKLHEATPKMVGGVAMTELANYQTALDADKAEKYKADLTPEEAAEFDRLVARRKLSFKSNAEAHALPQFKKYSVDVNKTTIESSTDTAATLLATSVESDKALAFSHLATAADAMAELGKFEGVPQDEVAKRKTLVVETAYVKALSLLKPDYKRAAAFYDKEKGRFGQYEPQAAAMAKDATDQVWADDSSQNAVVNSRDPKTGLVDWGAATTAASISEGSSPERIAYVQKRMADAAKTENTQREAAATQLLEELQRAYVSPDPNDVVTMRKAIHGSPLMAYVKPGDREKIMSYDGFTSPADKLSLDAMMNSGSQEQIDRVKRLRADGWVERNPDGSIKRRYLLDAPTRAQFQKWESERNTQEGKLRERTQRIVGDVWRDGLRKPPSPENPNAANAAEFNATVAAVLNAVETKKIDKLDDEIIREQVHIAQSKKEVASGGWFGGGKAEVSVVALADRMGDVDAEAKELGVAANLPRHEKAAAVHEARLLRAKDAERASAAGAAATEAYADELERGRMLRDRQEQIDRNEAFRKMSPEEQRAYVEQQTRAARAERYRNDPFDYFTPR